MSITYSTILKYLILPIADHAMHTKVASYYYMIRKMSKWPPDEIRKWQIIKLKELLIHAYEKTEYYKNLFDEYKFFPYNFKTIDSLSEIPILTKEKIKNNFNKIIPSKINFKSYINSSTGGSSGEPLTYLLDKKSWSFTTANTIFNWERAGYNYGDKYIALGSSSLFVNEKESFKHQIYYKLKNKISLNGINMSDEICQSYLNLIKTKQIQFLYGYASSLYLLAKYAKENNIAIKIKACFSTSEVLTENFSKSIQEGFNCKIIDFYGANDGGITAFNHKEGFYDVGYNSLLRIQTFDQEVTGAVLVTDLLNYAMPLINYEIGDEVEINLAKICNYSEFNGQIINKVLGRNSDIIVLANGNKITGPGFTILFKDLPVEHYFIEQTGMNSITCSIVKGSNFQQHHEDLIRSTFNKHLGENATFNILYTSYVNLTNSGKRQYFKKSEDNVSVRDKLFT